MPLKSRYRRVLDGIMIPSFKLDTTTATFTAGMAKRNSNGPFAAGVLTQGSRASTGIPDVLSFSRGSQIVDNFYQTIDSDQGSVVLWITPEWSYNDGVTHVIFYFGSGTNGIRLDKNANGSTFLYYGGQTLSVGAVAWAEGTTYSVVVRYNNHVTLDGTNYACVSVNDAHTFGITTVPTVSTEANQQIGSTGSTLSASSLIEGLTVYRRNLYDGTYGSNVGNGDEINLIYNAGTGKDPTDITGSWDVVFCLPTNSTAGALTTGTGDAWSHPHSSNLLTNGYLSGTTGWTAHGSPVVPTSVEFNGTSTSINAGSHTSVDNLFASAVTVEMFFRATLTGAAKYLITKSSATYWYVRVNANGTITAFVNSSGSGSTAVTTRRYDDGGWHHVAVTFNNAGDRIIRIYVDGVYQALGAAASGTITADAANSLYIGDGPSYFKGAMGWIRLSNNVRYSSNFIPPLRIAVPANDANTVRLFAMNEGTGTTITDGSSNAQNATLSSGTWNTTANMEVDTPNARTFNRGYVIAADAADEGYKQTFGSTYSEMMLNPGFETAGGGGADVFSDWAESVPGDSTVAAETTNIHSGTTACKMIRTASSSPSLSQSITTTIGVKYRVKFWVRGIGSGGTLRYNIPGGGPGNTATNITSTTYTEVVVEFTATGTTSGITFTMSAAGTAYVDDVSFKQYDLARGLDYVARALVYSEDAIGIPKLEIYDETSGATITSLLSAGQQDNIALTRHFEADTNWTKGTGWSIADSKAHKEPPTVSNLSQNMSILSNRYYKVTYTVLNYEAGSINIGVGTSTANGTSRTADGTYSEIILTPTSSDGILYFIADTSFHGDLDDVYVAAVPDEKNPEQLILSFELPIEPRVGSGTDCTQFSVKVVSSTAGIIGVNQVELLSNLIDNPSLDYGSGDPFIPSGFTNNTVDAGDTVSESTIVHSSNKSIKVTAATVDPEYLLGNVTSLATGRFCSAGYYVYGSATSGTVQPFRSTAYAQATASSSMDTPLIAERWTFGGKVGRSVSGSPRLFIYGKSTLHYIDDSYLFALDDVTLTATPASAANSIESSGIRVDGLDSLVATDSLGICKQTNGALKFRYIPRHSSSTMLLFGNSTPAIVRWYADGNNLIILDFSTTTLRLRSSDPTVGVQTATVTSSGIFTAGTSYLVELSYGASGVKLKINGATTLTLGKPSFAAALSFASFGASASVQQNDAVFLAP